MIKLAIMSTGNIFGEDDVLLHRNHFGSVKCISSFGVVFCMKSHEFLRKFKEIDASWAIVVAMVRQKTVNFTKRIADFQQLIQINT